jgi:site-specific DNA-adenine methylase
MIKSPLRYPGGKSRAVDLISTLLPAFDEFREPFLDGMRNVTDSSDQQGKELFISNYLEQLPE